MTMRIFRHTIWIDQPREAVFDFFTDFSQASRWRSFVKSMELRSPGRLQEGATIRVVMDVMGAEYLVDLNVLAVERPAVWRHRTNETDFTGHIEYRFEPEGNGTRVTMTLEAKPRSVYGWLALPQMFLLRGRTYRDQLPQLKRVMENA
jgi:uncharacterized membrane protein